MKAWLLCLILFCALAETDILTYYVDFGLLWGGICNLFNSEESTYDNVTKLCGLRLNQETKCKTPQLTEELNFILDSIKSASDQSVLNSSKSDWKNSFYSKTSLKIVSKSLMQCINDECPELLIDPEFDNVRDWASGDITVNVTYNGIFNSTIASLVKNGTSNSFNETYLNSFLVDIAAITSYSDSTFYSTSINASTAYAPPVRNSSKIKFVQNYDSTIAEISSSLLQQRQTGVTFIYDDDNKLFFLIRIIKNVFFTTKHLQKDWAINENIRTDLINLFETTGNPHTYVLLFQDKTNKDYSEQFLNLAMRHQQLREGIQIISFSINDRCSVYTKYLRTGASLITFGLSATYAPETPMLYMDPVWREAAVYLDGLTYITQQTPVPGHYILSRINFTERQPTASPVEAVAIFDCSKDTTTGIGSWVSSRREKIKLDSINSTLNGRYIKVGIINYPPFYDNGIGFSVPVMDTLAALAEVHYEKVYFTPNPNRPYFEDMMIYLENQIIDVGFAPVPLSSLNTQKVLSSDATLTITFKLLRQRPSRPADFLLLLRPLSMPVWLASVVLAFIFCGFLMVFGHLKPVIMHNLAEGEMTSKRNLFEVSALGVASTFSLTKLQIVPTTLSSRVFALIMWMFAYLLLVLYASAMMTILLRIREPFGTDISVDEVMNTNHFHTLIVIKNGIAYDSIISSLQNNSRPYSTVDSIEAAYNALMNDEKTILLTTSIEGSYISVNSCELEMIPYTRLYETILSFPYHQAWIYGPELESYYSIIRKSGVLEDAASVYFETGRCYQPNYKVPKPAVLTLGDCASIYIFLLIGIIVSFIIMGLELLVKRIVGKREAKDLPLLVPGRHYTARIVSIKLNGIDVIVENRPEIIYIPNSQLHSDPLKVYNALDMGLTNGDTIEVTYFGTSSNDNTELFCRYTPNQ